MVGVGHWGKRERVRSSGSIIWWMMEPVVILCYLGSGCPLGNG